MLYKDRWVGYFVISKLKRKIIVILRIFPIGYDMLSLAN
jgi:hypothetical protein